MCIRFSRWGQWFFKIICQTVSRERKGQIILYRINSVTDLFCKLNHNLINDVHIFVLCDQLITVGEHFAKNPLFARVLEDFIDNL